MSVWDKLPADQKEKYIYFLKVFGALSDLFKQKNSNAIPHLDSKFQETIFARVFEGEIVDLGNTPHDVLSIIEGERIGIGLKTWINTKGSFQKVMQLKRYQEEINDLKNNSTKLAYKISELKNDNMVRDYNRLGLTKEKNIYHYITRDPESFSIHECTYPLVDLNKLEKFKLTSTSFSWTDGKKNFKYTFSDSQLWQYFGPERSDTKTVFTFEVKIMKDPFTFLLNSFIDFTSIIQEKKQEIIEVFLPLYSYRTQEVEKKSGLNAWNASPKNKKYLTERPLNEIYIPIPIDFHMRNPDFFTNDIYNFIGKNNNSNLNDKTEKDVRFHLQLPNGKKIPSLITQSNMKALQSGSRLEKDENGKNVGQSALGQWLLVDVLGLKQRELVTREWLKERGTDSVRLWRNKDDYSVIYIDFAQIGSFEIFMKEQVILKNE